MSKTMRTRNLDPFKSMVILDATKDDLPDRIENPSVLRSNVNLPTGIEKEEETERHLQLVLAATTQTAKDAKAPAIPIPSVKEVDPATYDSLYPTGYAKDPSVYRVQGLSAAHEPDEVDYCADEEDDKWLRKLGPSSEVNVDLFEFIMDRLEKHAGSHTLKEEDAVKLFGKRTDSVIAVFGYWLEKRKRVKHPLILKVRTESRPDSNSSHDPYVAFRRRAEKMQTRKNRKSDQQNYLLMCKLKFFHSELMRDGLMELLRSIKQREILKLRASLLEREELRVSSQLLNDPSGRHCDHVMQHYPELSKLETENYYGEDAEEDVSMENEQFVDGSDGYDTESNVSTESWGQIRQPAAADRRGRSICSDLDSEVPFVAPSHDENLVSEAQYKGDEPPDYWGPDREFTFAPRKDCRYVMPSPPRSDDEDDDDDPFAASFDGFSIMEVPVTVKGHTTYQTVLGRKTLGRNRMVYFEYYPLPKSLRHLDLRAIAAEEEASPECDLLRREMTGGKRNTYVHTKGEPSSKPPAEHEDGSLYHIVCDSVDPLLVEEHDYCMPFIPVNVLAASDQASPSDTASGGSMDDGSSGETASSPDVSGDGENSLANAHARLDNPHLNALLAEPSPLTATASRTKPVALPAAKKPKAAKAAGPGQGLPAAAASPSVLPIAAAAVTQVKRKHNAVLKTDSSVNQNGDGGPAPKKPRRPSRPPAPRKTPVVGSATATRLDASKYVVLPVNQTSLVSAAGGSSTATVLQTTSQILGTVPVTGPRPSTAAGVPPKSAVPRTGNVVNGNGIRPGAQLTFISTRPAAGAASQATGAPSLQVLLATPSTTATN